MKIYIISARSVLSPSASTNRMLTLAKGLAGAGCDIRIFCLGPVGSGNKEGISGGIEGVPYSHLGGRTGLHSNSLQGKIFHFLVGAIDGMRVFCQEPRPDAVLLLSIRLIHLFPYLWIARRRLIPVFHERNEYPHRNVRTGYDRILLRLYMREVVPQFAGVALMTKALVNYFTENCRRCPPLLHLPMTVDVDRFTAEAPRPIPGKYIAYCGSSFGDKDGVPILVDAFARLASCVPDINLVLIGSDADPVVTARLKKKIQESGFQSRILLTGQIPRHDMPAWMRNAELLALARPPNLQAAGGFPTKLGEYLSSARPVVVTRVGEISDYLQDGVNAWLAEPGSVDSFFEKMKEALLAGVDARDAVGRLGRQVAMRVFSSAVQGRRFGQFIRERIEGAKTA